MFELPITKISYKLLKAIYKDYLQKADSTPDNKARIFNTIPADVYKQIPKENCRMCLNELNENGFVRLYTDGGFMLTNKAILFLENHIKGNVSDLSDFTSKFF